MKMRSVTEMKDKRYEVMNNYVDAHDQRMNISKKKEEIF
jgi:hypothetical protein